ncbi:aminoglycoside phosphotransferase family protein [Streptomyces sp. NPDC057702]|uniref:aminoglycoside phosphotransferase family protein n=1 Tax=unclassified Streptomyces TaxID=2593676 RepID=UPI003683ACF0
MPPSSIPDALASGSFAVPLRRPVLAPVVTPISTSAAGPACPTRTPTAPATATTITPAGDAISPTRSVAPDTPPVAPRAADAPAPLVLPADLPVVTEMSKTASGRAWLATLPALIAEFQDRWSLRLGPPIHGGSCSWVAPATLPDGGAAVLKLTWPHREASGEARGLRTWAGDGAVRLLAADQRRYALLVERCVPGTELDDAEHLTPEARLLAAAELLRGLWSAPVPRAGLETLATVTGEWATLVERRMARLAPGYDPALVAVGADLLRRLPASATRQVVVHGDFNPGNILAAGRRPWLAIDPKPMVGDPGYDPWPLLTQLDDPFEYADPGAVLAHRYALFADAVGEDPRRLLAWSMARAVESALWFAAMGEVADGAEEMAQARTLATVAGL